jgi:hypothetical protein
MFQNVILKVFINLSKHPLVFPKRMLQEKKKQIQKKRRRSKEAQPNLGSPHSPPSTYLSPSSCTAVHRGMPRPAPEQWDGSHAPPFSF